MHQRHRCFGARKEKGDGKIGDPKACFQDLKRPESEVCTKGHQGNREAVSCYEQYRNGRPKRSESGILAGILAMILWGKARVGCTLGVKHATLLPTLSQYKAFLTSLRSHRGHTTWSLAKEYILHPRSAHAPAIAALFPLICTGDDLQNLWKLCWKLCGWKRWQGIHWAWALGEVYQRLLSQELFDQSTDLIQHHIQLRLRHERWALCY